MRRFSATPHDQLLGRHLERARRELEAALNTLPPPRGLERTAKRRLDRLRGQLTDLHRLVAEVTPLGPLELEPPPRPLPPPKEKKSPPAPR